MFMLLAMLFLSFTQLKLCRRVVLIYEASSNKHMQLYYCYSYTPYMIIFLWFAAKLWDQLQYQDYRSIIIIILTRYFAIQHFRQLKKQCIWQCIGPDSYYLVPASKPVLKQVHTCTEIQSHCCEATIIRMCMFIINLWRQRKCTLSMPHRTLAISLHLAAYI